MRSCQGPRFQSPWLLGPIVRSDAHSTAYAEDSEFLNRRHQDRFYFEGLDVNHEWKTRQHRIQVVNEALWREDVAKAKQRAVEGIGNPESAQSDSVEGIRTGTAQACGGSSRPGPSTFDHIAEPQADGSQLLNDQRGLATPTLSCPQDIESISWQDPGHLTHAYRLTVCHALMGTSVVGVATSLSLALWWSIAHGDPGSGFTIGSYVLAVFGVLVAIPGYQHSKVCKCWESKSKGC